MKRFLSGLVRTAVVASIATAFATSSALTARAASVTLDGVPVSSVQSEAGHLLIPFRAPMQHIGAVVNYSKPTATASMGGHQLVTIHTGNTAASIRGNPTVLSVAPALIHGMAYVPVDALHGICGAHVVYGIGGQSATVTNCTLVGLNRIAATLPQPAAVPVPAAPAAPNFWPWLIGLLILAALIGLIAWLLSRRQREIVTTNVYSQTGRVAGETTPGAPPVRGPDDPTRRP